jgi:hypothetical protein
MISKAGRRASSQQRVRIEGSITLERLADAWDVPNRQNVNSPDRHWVCELWFFDIERREDCPRCRKPSQWTTETRIFPRGQISSMTIHAPFCPCPDNHIREGIASALAEALIAQWRTEQQLAEEPTIDPLVEH